MAVYSEIEVGLKHPFDFLGIFQKYPPVYNDAGLNTGSWSFGASGNYPRPFTSYHQNLVNATYTLGPYCRQLGGVAGRLVVSTQSPSIGQLGFVRQCWYGFEDGPYNTDSENNQYLSKAEWWNSETKKYVFPVRDLMTEGHPQINVEVAYAAIAADSDNNWQLSEKAGLLLNQILGVFSPPNYGSCGDGSTSGGMPSYPFPDLGWPLFGIPYAYLSSFLGPNMDSVVNGPIYNFLLPLINQARNAGVNPDSPVADGNPYSPQNLLQTLTNLFDVKLTESRNFLNSLANDIPDFGPVKFGTLVGLLGAAGEAGSLFFNTYYLPNLNYGFSELDFLNPTRYTGGSPLTPYIWRPSDDIQQKWAGYLLNGPDGSPLLPKPGFDDDALENYVPETTPTDPNTNRNDPLWHLTMLNRGGGKTNENPIGGTGAYVDPNTNEFVIPEQYGFARGGSVQTSDPLINYVEENLGEQVANSFGTLLDMSPGTAFFVPAVLPILELERLGRTNKELRGEEVNPVTNLDGLNDTYFDMRITAENLKKGNPTMYNYLVNNGQMQAVD